MNDTTHSDRAKTLAAQAVAEAKQARRVTYILALAIGGGILGLATVIFAGGC